MTVTLAHGATYTAPSTRPALSLAEWLVSRPSAARDTLTAHLAQKEPTT